MYAFETTKIQRYHLFQKCTTKEESLLHLSFQPIYIRQPFKSTKSWHLACLAYQAYLAHLADIAYLAYLLILEQRTYKASSLVCCGVII